MKKEVVFVFVLSLIVILFLAFISALENGSQSDLNELEQAQGQAQDIQDIVDKIPLDDEGEIDQGKLVEIESSIQKRINLINSWLDENTSWLLNVFGMKPEVSWKFAINLYLVLFFLTFLALNGDLIFDFIPKLYAKLVGLILLIVLIQTKTIVFISSLLSAIFDWWVFNLAILIGLFVVIQIFEKYWIKKRKEAIRDKNIGEAKQTSKEALEKSKETEKSVKGFDSLLSDDEE